MSKRVKDETKKSAGQRSFSSRLFEDFMELTKLRLSLLVVSTTAFGYFIATKSLGDFSWVTLIHIIIGTALAAFGSSVYNQLMEVDADAKMSRTLDRPLPSNRIPKPAAFVIGWVLCAFGIIHLGMKVNAMAAVFAGLTLFTYLFLYTPMKRRTSFNTIVGAVSGAIPPLIGWAGGGGHLASWGAVYVFGLLFFWQLPHFVAINWMYREEYEKGGFVMWSNNDESGDRSARLALIFSVAVFIFGVGIVFSGIMLKWAVIAGVILGGGMVYYALRFCKTHERKDARSLFFYTLIYLPLAMIVSYVAWIR